jgi:hypothetical protein
MLLLKLSKIHVVWSKMSRYFLGKNHYFTPKNHSFYNYGGRRENFWGISCEKSRFYAKKTIFFPILGDPPLLMHMIERIYGFWLPLWYLQTLFKDMLDCAQKIRYVFDVIVTSWALFGFWISWNFARDISTVFEEIKHLRSRAPGNILPDY